MKKIITLLLAALLCVSLCACGENEYDKAQREANEAARVANELNQQYENAKDSYDKLQNDIANYKSARDALG